MSTRTIAGFDPAVLIVVPRQQMATSAPSGTCTLSVASGDEGDQSCVNRLLEELTSLNRDLHVPTPADYGIDRAQWQKMIPLMISQAIASGAPANNPRLADPEEMQALYERAWSER